MKIKIFLTSILLMLGLLQNNTTNTVLIYGENGYLKSIDILNNSLKQASEKINENKSDEAKAAIDKAKTSLTFIEDNAKIDTKDNRVLSDYLTRKGFFPLTQLEKYKKEIKDLEAELAKKAEEKPAEGAGVPPEAPPFEAPPLEPEVVKPTPKPGPKPAPKPQPLSPVEKIKKEMAAKDSTSIKELESKVNNILADRELKELIDKPLSETKSPVQYFELLKAEIGKFIDITQKAKTAGNPLPTEIIQDRTNVFVNIFNDIIKATGGDVQTSKIITFRRSPEQFIKERLGEEVKAPEEIKKESEFDLWQKALEQLNNRTTNLDKIEKDNFSRRKDPKIDQIAFANYKKALKRINEEFKTLAETRKKEGETPSLIAKFKKLNPVIEKLTPKAPAGQIDPQASFDLAKDNGVDILFA